MTKVVDFLKNYNEYDDYQNCINEQVSGLQESVPPLELDSLAPRQLMEFCPEEANSIPEHKDVYFQHLPRSVFYSFLIIKLRLTFHFDHFLLGLAQILCILLFFHLFNRHVAQNILWNYLYLLLKRMCT